MNKFTDLDDVPLKELADMSTKELKAEAKRTKRLAEKYSVTDVQAYKNYWKLYCAAMDVLESEGN